MDWIVRVDDQRLELAREPILLAVFSLLAIILFSAVAGVSRIYHAQHASLGDRWFSRGMVDLSAQKFDAAVTEFHAALLYAPDNYEYEANLARALIGAKRTSEADAYLINLWERQPEDGLVNLELARIAAQKSDTEQALRYYHNAIYANWPADKGDSRRDARLELIEYLLSIDAKAQAESELIALEANLGNEPAEQNRAGELFIRTRDYERALAAYRLSLKSDRHNEAALAGAGLAAFELGRYPAAQRYLQAALAVNSSDARSADLLKTTEMVMQMDPFQLGISAAQRDRIAVKAFAIAGERLKACGTADTGLTSSSGTVALLADSWAKMTPQITEAALQRNPDLVEKAMGLVFNIERQTSTMCAPASGTDSALLLIAKLHEGS